MANTKRMSNLEHKSLLSRMGLIPTEVVGDGTDEGTSLSSIAFMKKIVETSQRSPSVFDQQTDWELSNQIRMLTRKDSSHEGVVCAARTRIMKLHLQHKAAVGVLKDSIEHMQGLTEDEMKDRHSPQEIAMYNQVLKAIEELK